MSNALVPATLGESPTGQAPGVPYSARYDDVYHPVAGAWAQAQHVFMGGNGLPQRWQGRGRFVILETGFGLGNNFLATWSTWLDDPERCDHLIFISVEKHPLTRDDLSRVHHIDAVDADSERRRQLGAQLAAAWPTLTPGWHSLRFDAPEGQSVSLMLGLGDVATLLPELMASVDAFYLDGFAPAKNPDMWAPQRLARLQRLAAPSSTAATWSCARVVRDGLAQAGFEVSRAPVFTGKREMIRAHHAPRYVPPPPPGGLGPPPTPTHRHALVIGAGLAGCSAAWALCREGWTVHVLDRQPAPGSETSGNPGGLFHSVLHADDGIHARAHRAAALSAWRVIRQAVNAGVRGSVDGLVRLDAKTNVEEAQALLQRVGMPQDHVQWLTQDEVAAVLNVPVPSGGWLFHQAGWVHPAGLCDWLLNQARQTALRGGGLAFSGGQVVASLRRSAAGLWQALGPQGELIHEAPHVVLACAHGVSALLQGLPEELACAPLPMSRVRGQVSWVAKVPGARLPRLPVAGGGYALSLDEESLLFGATTQHHDDDPNARAQDHDHNVRVAQQLGVLPADVPPLTGRVGWRATTPDRLPIVGALPWSVERLHRAGQRLRLDQPRLIPRQRDAAGGLYALSGLGSRGITWSVMAAELLVHWMSATPCPVEVSLRDALDPARFVARQFRLHASPASHLPSDASTA